jgi:capsular polysaccharide biosynthesis protein
MDQRSSFPALLSFALRRHGWFVVVALVGALAAAGALVSRQDEVHRASMKLVVSQNGVLTPELRDSVVPVTQTLRSLLGSNSLAEEVIRRAQVDETPTSLLDDLAVSTLADASVIDVSYDDTDPDTALRVLAAVGTTFSAAVDQRFGGAGDDPDGVEVEVFDPPHVEPELVSPRPVLTMAIAGLLGVVLGIGGALVAARMDRRLRGRRTVEDALGVPVIVELSRRAVSEVSQEAGGDADSIGLLREAVLAQAPSLQPVAVMGVTPGRAEPAGVALLVATALARAGEDVVVLDADVRRSALADLLEVDRGTAGLSEALSGSLEVEEALLDVNVEVGRSTDGPRSDLALARPQRAAVAGGESLSPAGRPDREGSPDLSSREARDYYEKELADYRGRRRLREPVHHGRLQAVVSGKNRAVAGRISEATVRPLVERLASGRRRVVVAVPPAWETADGIPLMRIAGSLVVVLTDGRTTRDEAAQARVAMERLGMPPALIVMIRGGSKRGAKR